jgi:hypothetical protein
LAVQPDIPDIPGIVEGSIVRFDYSNATERKIALLYRQHEVRSVWSVGKSEPRQVPFMVYNVPEIDEVVQKWTVRVFRWVEHFQDDNFQHKYLMSAFGSAQLTVTHSKSNHFRV